MTKPNKDGWIRHRGGKCPVEKGVAVDIRVRSGDVATNCKALIGESDNPRLFALDWSHESPGHRNDIMAYRLHKPEEQPDPASEPAAVDAITSVLFSTPITWRDRVREIDATVEALEEERASLIQKLEDEGFKLIRVDAKVSPRAQADPSEDMSDWRNWRKGDKLSVIDRIEDSHKFEFGQVVTIVEHDTNKGKPAPYCTGGTGEGWWVLVENLEFHSRPTA